MKTQILSISIILLCFFHKGLSQAETFKWYFGQHAAIDFSSSPPTSLNNSAMSTVEGCASIADANGNLLFYTDATKIWDASHSIMANGNGLLGNGPLFTSQSSVIIKQPAANSIYYVFTLADEGQADGLRYSVVDMNLAAGMGSVTVKNIPLYTPSCEKMSAVNHCNGTDIWLVTHDTNDNFRSFLITSSGINPSPVISTFTTSNSSYLIGCMKISPNGRKLALAALTITLNTGQFEMFDFDNSTGIVSNRQTLFSDYSAYGCEFSPDGTKLYGSDLHHVLQWDLCASSNSAIIASQSTISSVSFTGGNLQLAADGKIYVSKVNDTKLAVINNPNLAGNACNYVNQGLSLSTGTLMAGLPNFNSSFFFKKSPRPFAFDHTPSGACLTSTFNALTCSFGTPDISSVQWSFGDPASVSQNTSAAINAIHKFSAPGIYTVQLIRNYNCYSDTISQAVIIPDLSPTLTINGRVSMCSGESNTLSITGADSYTWTNFSGPGNIVITPTASSVYTVTGTNTVSGCSSTATVNINVLKCLGLNENSLSSFKLFPNPLEDVLQLECNSEAQLSIYNGLGVIVLETSVHEGFQSLDLSNLPNGIYHVKFDSYRKLPEYFRVIKVIGK